MTLRNIYKKVAEQMFERHGYTCILLNRHGERKSLGDTKARTVYNKYMDDGSVSDFDKRSNGLFGSLWSAGRVNTENQEQRIIALLLMAEVAKDLK